MSNAKSALDELVQGYRTFRDTYFRENQAFIESLMDQGQTPKVMMIACSDSRIDPSLKFGVEPGEMFIVRNVANLVPPFEPDGHAHGTSAALEFAVRSLEVEHIIVMGHARCGGIHSLMRQTESDGDFVSTWMRIATPARDKARAATKDPVEGQRICEQESVKVSLANLMTFPWIKDRVEKGKLQLHGWHFDLGIGTLYACDSLGKFTPL